MVNKALDLSIIITTHNEGLLIHKTIRSVEAALAKASSLSYEIIISADSVDSSTASYLSNVQQQNKYHILYVDYKDLSRSRNNAVQNAKGTYVFFIDGDDLISENWLLHAHDILNNHNGPAVVHPEFSIVFGAKDLFWRKRSSEDISFDTLCMVDNNLWDSACMAKRSIFLDHPYHENGDGLGYEDKHFNCQTLASNIPHIIVPDAILFVRRRTTSLLSTSNDQRWTIAPTNLLSFRNITNLDVTNYDDQIVAVPTHKKIARELTSSSKDIARTIHTYSKGYSAYRKLMLPLRKKRQKYLLDKAYSKIPSSVIDQWRKIHSIENSCFPSKDLLKSIEHYSADNITAGNTYSKIIHSMTKCPDTLFFVPHIIKGGADKVFLNYSEYLSSESHGWNIAMLQTESKESVWQDKVSPRIDYINLHEITNNIDRETAFRLMALLVVQNNIKRIIIGNSQFGYDFAEAYSTLLTHQNVAIYCFGFGEEFDDEGRLWGHIHTGIPKAYQLAHRIITDNKNTVTKLCNEYGFSPEKFAVHYQPTDVKIIPHQTHANGPVKILWASRICKQKRPDILLAVSKKLNPQKFIIDAYGQLEENFTKEYFQGSNVTYKGSFNGASSLPASEYDIYLYTSEGDGIPNVLQEMTAKGLPIVASGVGGIDEFINYDTGILIKDHNNIDSYVNALHSLDNPAKRITTTENAQHLLRSKFSKQTWMESVKETFDK